ncbi:MAG TPA: hypothetical protein VHH34_24250 [Pseudonocardiaceae bacterium]|nr:hypothetical protein [Pseudonocardiaceae bacterium]
MVGDRIWQLTWRDGVVLEWDRATLNRPRFCSGAVMPAAVAARR